MTAMILRAEVIFKTPPSSALEAIEQLARTLNVSPPPSGLGEPPPPLGVLLTGDHPDQLYGLGVVQTDTASSFDSFKGYNDFITIDITAPLIAGDTISFGPIALTYAVAAANQNEITIGVDDATTAANTAAVINAHTLLSQFVYATSALAVVTTTFLGVSIEAQLIPVTGSNVTGTIVSYPFFLPATIATVATIVGDPVFTITPGYDASAWQSMVGEQVDAIDPATGNSRFNGVVTVQAFNPATNSVTLSPAGADTASIVIGDFLTPAIALTSTQSYLSFGGRP